MPREAWTPPLPGADARALRQWNPARQNLTRRRIAVVVLGKARWKLIRDRLADVAGAIAAAQPGRVSEVHTGITTLKMAL